MLKKSPNQQVEFAPGQFLSNMSVADKKVGGHHPLINLKYLNSSISYQHFKTDRVNFIKEFLQRNDFLIKIDLKDDFLYILPNKQSIKNICDFDWR